MKNYKLLIVLFAFLLLNGCSSSTTETTNENSNTQTEKSSALTEDEINELVFSLNFIKALDNYYREMSNGEVGLSTIINAPTGNETEYTVEVGVDGEERFELEAIIYINAKTKAIDVEDIILGERMSLEEYEAASAE